MKHVKERKNRLKIAKNSLLLCGMTRQVILLPQIIMILLKRVQKTLVRVRENLPETAEEILHFSPARIPVHGTGRLDYGKIQHLRHMFYMAFRKINQRPDYRDTGSAH